MATPRLFQVMISIDGSAQSFDCFQVIATQIVTQSLLKPNYRINVLHIFNVSKEYLAFNQKPDYLHQIYESELISRLVPNRFSLTWLPYNGRTTTRDQIMTLADGYRADLLVVGFVGRKGPKADPTILGSAVDHNLRNGRCPLLVVKAPVLRKDTPASSYLWVVLIDGSERSLKAARFAAGLMAGEYDRMQLRHVVKGGGEPEGLRTRAGETLEGTGVNWTLEVVDAGDADVQSAVLDYVNQGPDLIDFIVVGVDGSGVGSKARWQVGHVTEAVLRTSKLNVLIYK